jgi:cytidylate kinase
MASSFTHPIRPILAAIRSTPTPSKPILESRSEMPRPFITISREPGAGAINVGVSFVESINSDVPDDEKWTCWDREIVDKVAADHHLSARLIDGLEENNHSWMTNFLSSLSFADSGKCYNEDLIYHKVQKTIEALARTGRIVVVGRGGVFITRHLPWGIHIRLVAPLKHRIKFIARSFELPEEAAAARIHELEKNRRVFFNMHWPNHPLDPDLFSLTINTAEVHVPSIVQMLRTLVQDKISQATRWT